MRRQILGVITAVSVGISCARTGAAQSRLEAWEGHYVSSPGRGGGPGATAEADVFAAYEGQAIYIDFKIEGRDNVILGAVAGGQGLTAKQFTFSFTDNTGKRGSGTLARSANGVVLRLTRADNRPASGPADSLYGEYFLERKEAKGRTDRHPWSLGRNQPRPPSPSAPDPR